MKRNKPRLLVDVLLDIGSADDGSTFQERLERAKQYLENQLLK